MRTLTRSGWHVAVFALFALAAMLLSAPQTSLGDPTDDPAVAPTDPGDPVVGEGEGEAGDGEGEAGEGEGEAGEGEGEAGDGEGDAEEPEEPLDDLVYEPSRVTLTFEEPGKPIAFEAGSHSGWAVKIPEGLPLATPAIAHGRVYVGAGYGSFKFYALDQTTGEVSWEFQCGDDGPTAAVVWDNYVAYNTESCTLYVHNATTGEKLWERWLGDPLMNMPAIADGKLYMVYPTGGGGGFGPGNFDGPDQNVWPGGDDEGLLAEELLRQQLAVTLAEVEKFHAMKAEIVAQLNDPESKFTEEEVAAFQQQLADLDNMIVSLMAQADELELALEALLPEEGDMPDGDDEENSGDSPPEMPDAHSQVFPPDGNDGDTDTDTDTDEDGEADGEEPTDNPAPLEPEMDEPADPTDPESPNDPETPERWYSHSLICLDVKTGETIWERKIDGDAISAPIVSDAAIYLTTFTGTMYCFGAHDGEARWEQPVAVTSAPWIVGDKVYASQRVEGEEYTTEQGVRTRRQYEGLTQFGAGGGRAAQEYRRDKADYLNREERRHSAQAEAEDALDEGVGFSTAPGTANLGGASSNTGIDTVAGAWSYQGSRPAVIGNVMFNSQGPIVQARVASSGTALWRKKLRADNVDDATAPFGPPAVVAGRLYLGSTTGDILCLDGISGDVIWAINIGHPIVFQPAVHDGWIYVGTMDGLMVAINANDPSATGWTQWGGSASHNGIER